MLSRRDLIRTIYMKKSWIVKFYAWTRRFCAGGLTESESCAKLAGLGHKSSEVYHKVSTQVLGGLQRVYHKVSTQDLGGLS